MRSRSIASCFIAMTLMTFPALAQTTTAPSTEPATPSPAVPGLSASASGEFMTEQSMGQWRASKLVGVDVYGIDNQKIGDITEVLLSREGMAEAVVIGVGGFLGLGEKNVAMPFKTLEWATEPRVTAGTMTPATTGVAPGATAPNTAGTSAMTSIDPAGAEARQGYPDRAVLRMTKADLQNAPAFRYISETRATNTSPAASPPVAAPRQ